MDQVSSCNLADRLSAFHCLKAWERISRVEYPPWHMAKLELNQCAAVKAKRCRFIAVSYKAKERCLVTVQRNALTISEGGLRQDAAGYHAPTLPLAVHRSGCQLQLHHIVRA